MQFFHCAKRRMNTANGCDVDISPSIPSESDSISPSEIADRGPIRVLCVDDNRDLANTVNMLLDYGKFDSRVCYEGTQAIAEATHFRPHVCLIDLLMPGMSGLEVARQIIRNFGESPPFLIAVTAMGEEKHRQQVTEAGFHQHLIKPVAPDELLAAVIAGAGTRTNCAAR
jgi:two-component system OmpR family response regulator